MAASSRHALHSTHDVDSVSPIIGSPRVVLRWILPFSARPRDVELWTDWFAFRMRSSVLIISGIESAGLVAHASSRAVGRACDSPAFPAIYSAAIADTRADTLCAVCICRGFFAELRTGWSFFSHLLRFDERSCLFRALHWRLRGAASSTADIPEARAETLASNSNYGDTAS